MCVKVPAPADGVAVVRGGDTGRHREHGQHLLHTMEGESILYIGKYQHFIEEDCVRIMMINTL